MCVYLFIYCIIMYKVAAYTSSLVYIGCLPKYYCGHDMFMIMYITDDVI